MEAFPKLAGYDMRRRMHALVGYGPEREQTQRDLEFVEKSLTQENLLAQAARFLHNRDLQFMSQVYGRGLARDLLAAYALTDIAEVEDGVVLPEASWAAHTVGHRLVSAEAYTFLSTKPEPVRPRNGKWEATPALLRWHANHFFGEGINRINMHSFSYSPPEIPLPGWRMYAETHLNRNVPWWWAMPQLTQWIARNQWVLQSGEPIADSLVYPIASNPLEEPYNRLTQQPVSAANAIDGANELTLPLVAARAERGDYEFSNLCVLADIQSADEAGALARLLRNGGSLICCKTLPGDWPALVGDNHTLRTEFDQLNASGRVVAARSRGWQAVLRENSSVRWAPAEAAIRFQHRRVGDSDIYFLTNHGDAFHGEVSYPHVGATVELWDADTGSIRHAVGAAERDGRTQIPLAIEHFESVIVSFTPGRSPPRIAKAPATNRRDRREPLELGGPWQVHVPAHLAVSPIEAKDFTLNQLVPWRQIESLERFAGTVTYQSTFALKSEDCEAGGRWRVNLGEVFEVAQVSINGVLVGTAWKPPFQVEISEHLHPGENTISIQVANLLKNHLEESDVYSRPSGLLGPVRLAPVKPMLVDQ